MKTFKLEQEYLLKASATDKLSRLQVGKVDRFVSPLAAPGG